MQDSTMANSEQLSILFFKKPSDNEIKEKFDQFRTKIYDICSEYHNQSNSNLSKNSLEQAQNQLIELHIEYFRSIGIETESLMKISNEMKNDDYTIPVNKASRDFIDAVIEVKKGILTLPTEFSKKTDSSFRSYQNYDANRNSNTAIIDRSIRSQLTKVVYALSMATLVATALITTSTIMLPLMSAGAVLAVTAAVGGKFAYEKYQNSLPKNIDKQAADNMRIAMGSSVNEFRSEILPKINKLVAGYDSIKVETLKSLDTNKERKVEGKHSAKITTQEPSSRAKQ